VKKMLQRVIKTIDAFYTFLSFHIRFLKWYLCKVINNILHKVFIFIYMCIFSTFNFLFFKIFSFKIIYQKNPLFLILHFQKIMNSWDFKEIFVFRDFEIDNGVLGLDRDCYLSIVKFLDSSILRKVWVNIFCFSFLCFL
jgi:hypothetical protein